MDFFPIFKLIFMDIPWILWVGEGNPTLGFCLVGDVLRILILPWNENHHEQSPPFGRIFAWMFLF